MNIRNSYSCCIIKRNYQTNFSISINSFSTSYQKCARCSRKNRSFDGIYKEINDKNTPCYAITPIVISSTRHVVAKGLRNNMKKNYKKVYIYISFKIFKIPRWTFTDRETEAGISEIGLKSRHVRDFYFPRDVHPFSFPPLKSYPIREDDTVHRIRARFRDHLMPKYHRHRQ